MPNLNGLPKPDLFIAALGRSGSTMLANLLTTPPDRWVMIEPRFANGSTGLDVVDQALSFGLDITLDAWTVRAGETPDERTARVLANPLTQLHRWGVKEVRPDLLQATLDQMDPKKVIILVRDLRDAATSLVEKTQRDADSRYDDLWIRNYLTTSPAAILDLLQSLESTDHRIVRYEDLVMSEAERNAIAAWLDWPLDGDPARHLVEIYKRGREVEIHAGKVTDRAVRRRMATDNVYAREIADWASQTNRKFQQRFGYGDQ